MKWTPVESSVFWAAGYAEDNSLLYLLFRSGRGLSLFRCCPSAVRGVSRGRFQRAIFRTQHSGALPLRANAPAAVTITPHTRNKFLVTEKT